MCIKELEKGKDKNYQSVRGKFFMPTKRDIIVSTSKIEGEEADDLIHLDPVYKFRSRRKSKSVQKRRKSRSPKTHRKKL